MIKVDRVNRFNRAFLVIFTDAMQSIKPLKETQKIQDDKSTDLEARTYSHQMETWKKAFRFNLELRKYVNNLNNLIVLAGGSNSSDGSNDLTQKSIDQFDSEINSEKFKNNMKSCEPKISEDPDYPEKIKIWKKTFDFPKKLNDFIQKLKIQPLPIPAKTFLELVDDFIDELNINEDEFLITSTQKIGGQGFQIDFETIELRSESEINTLTNNIQAKSTIPTEYKTRFEKDKEIFKKTMKEAKKIQLEIKAEKKIIEKKYDDANLKFEIDEEIVKVGTQAVKKAFPQYMNVIAISSIVVILGLVILSVWCPGCTFESSAVGNLSTIETVEKISNTETRTTTTIIDISKDNSNSMGKPTGMPLIEFVGNPYTKILESNVVMVLVSTFVAPMAARVLKEKFDIDVTEKQISMIANDGIKSVTMYANEADKLRDVSGYIPRKYQKILRDKAFNSLRKNYDDKKYKDLVANVGAQVFDKAIENAVRSGRLERFPLEKKQVEELIIQSIDAAPQIVEWQNLDEDVKNTFIEGNIRKLLQNTGTNRWSHKALESVFDAEISKRILGGALVQKNKLLEEIDAENPYLKYTSTAIDAILELKKSHK